jgi:hypothetical protein
MMKVLVVRRIVEVTMVGVVVRAIRIRTDQVEKKGAKRMTKRTKRTMVGIQSHHNRRSSHSHAHNHYRKPASHRPTGR